MTQIKTLKKTNKKKTQLEERVRVSGIFGAVAAENEAQLSFHRNQPSANAEMSSSSTTLLERIKRAYSNYSADMQTAVPPALPAACESLNRITARVEPH